MVALWSPEFACVLQKGTTSRESFDATKYRHFFKKGTTLSIACSMSLKYWQMTATSVAFRTCTAPCRMQSTQTQRNIFGVTWPELRGAVANEFPPKRWLEMLFWVGLFDRRIKHQVPEVPVIIHSHVFIHPPFAMLTWTKKRQKPRESWSGMRRPTGWSGFMSEAGGWTHVKRSIGNQNSIIPEI